MLVLTHQQHGWGHCGIDQAASAGVDALSAYLASFLLRVPPHLENPKMLGDSWPLHFSAEGCQEMTVMEYFELSRSGWPLRQKKRNSKHIFCATTPICVLIKSREKEKINLHFHHQLIYKRK